MLNLEFTWPEGSEFNKTKVLVWTIRINTVNTAFLPAKEKHENMEISEWVSFRNLVPLIAYFQKIITETIDTLLLLNTLSHNLQHFFLCKGCSRSVILVAFIELKGKTNSTLAKLELSIVITNRWRCIYINFWRVVIYQARINFARLQKEINLAHYRSENLPTFSFPRETQIFGCLLGY